MSTEACIKILESQVIKQMSEISDTLKEVVKRNEHETKVDRSCNVLLHNIPESDSDKPEIRKSGSDVEWFRSYLTGRRQIVC